MHEEAEKTRPYSATPLTWFDVSLIGPEHDQIASAEPELQDHLLLVHLSFDQLFAILKHHPYSTDDKETVVALRLGVRLFNSSGAALHLARDGFYQPAIAMIRDVLEIMFLVDLFRRDRTEFRDWLNLDAKKRNDRFKMVAVRKKLDEMDGFKERKRAKAYKLLSNYAAHVSPEGFSIISPGGMTQIGPFVNSGLFKAVIEELVKVMPAAVAHLDAMLTSGAARSGGASLAFYQAYSRWRAIYLARSKQNPG